ncbi:MAG: coenzyme F420-0:L-glutamate ligase [Candidatus Woesearchaeota archaeon]
MKDYKPGSAGVKVTGITTRLHMPGEEIVDFTLEHLRKYLGLGSGILKDDDILCVTESIVARAQNNFVTINQIVDDFRKKMDWQSGERVGIVFPIFSRNRYSMMLQAFARAVPEIVLMLNYPRDEQGNQILSDQQVMKLGKNPYVDSITMQEYDSLSPRFVHPITDMNYIDFYSSICKAESCNVEIVLNNNPVDILSKTSKVLVSNVHDRETTKALIKQAGTEIVLGLDDLCNQSSEIQGYNPQFGLLGSNVSDQATERLKLFPRDGDEYAERIRTAVYNQFGKKIHVIIYADGAYKDPSTRIWELADPVVCAGCTPEIADLFPNELKIKASVDSYKGQGLSVEEIQQKVLQDISRVKSKSGNPRDSLQSLGTTPRRIVDLLGSLADLASGSGDRCTPMIHIANYL